MIEKIVFHLRRIRPQAVLSLDPNGGYGHPDHIAISQFPIHRFNMAPYYYFHLL